MKGVKKPNFLIIGAPKSGTSSIYHYLLQHPDIYMSPVKEPGFFAVEGNPAPRNRTGTSYNYTTWENYLSLFKNAKNQKVIGEASVSYMVSAGVIPRIHKYVPDTKMLAILRQPAERAYSGMMMRYRHGFLESHELPTFFANEPKEPVTDLPKDRSSRAVRNGFYYVHLKKFFDNFDQNKLFVCLFDDLKQNRQVFLERIFSFLDVDPSVSIDFSVKYNQAFLPRFKWLYRVLNNSQAYLQFLNPIKRNPAVAPIYRALLNLNKVSTPPMPPELRSQLTEIYREDILRLQDLIQRDLSAWLE